MSSRHDGSVQGAWGGAPHGLLAPLVVAYAAYEALAAVVPSLGRYLGLRRVLLELASACLTVELWDQPKPAGRRLPWIERAAIAGRMPPQPPAAPRRGSWPPR